MSYKPISLTACRVTLFGVDRFCQGEEEVHVYTDSPVGRFCVRECSAFGVIVWEIDDRDAGTLDTQLDFDDLEAVEVYLGEVLRREMFEALELAHTGCAPLHLVVPSHIELDTI